MTPGPFLPLRAGITQDPGTLPTEPLCLLRASGGQVTSLSLPSLLPMV